MIVAVKNYGKLHRIIDSQPIKKFSLREIHHTRSRFDIFSNMRNTSTKPYRMPPMATIKCY